MCDLHDQHDHEATPANGTGLSRRRIMQLLSAAGVTTATLAADADPVLAASADDTPAAYTAPTGLAEDSAAKRSALAWIEGHATRITGLNAEIWEQAELSLREWNSSLAQADFLKKAGFDVEFGTAGFPTAFTATFTQGKGGPALGFSGEYDALPGLSQHKGVGHHDPREYVHDPPPVLNAWGDPQPPATDPATAAGTARSAPPPRPPPRRSPRRPRSTASRSSAPPPRRPSSARPTRSARASTTASTRSWTGTRPPPTPPAGAAARR
ncbi:hypothetical protein [Streptomyces sp. JW3]|uniref:hypothetical protein n=1 Tax=Streptomyces sp. JW3 TaxID=3456955 RepID=UPI003FA47774